MRRQGTYEDLFAVNADGTNDRQLVASTDHDITPGWSADGKAEFFLNRIQLNVPAVFDKIKVVKAAGGSAIRMNNNSVGEYGPVVIP